MIFLLYQIQLLKASRRLLSGALRVLVYRKRKNGGGPNMTRTPVLGSPIYMLRFPRGFSPWAGAWTVEKTAANRRGNCNWKESRKESQEESQEEKKKQRGRQSNGRWAISRGPAAELASVLGALRRIASVSIFLFAAAATGAEKAKSEPQPEEILIVRPLENNKTEVNKRKILFEVEVSSFDPVLRVTINGKVARIKPGPTVLVKKKVTLKRGLNKFLVKVTTEFETASKEFKIRYRRKKKAPVTAKKDPFQLITLVGSQNSSNALKVPAGLPETSARRDFLILIPKYEWNLNNFSILRVQGVVSRDLQDKKELESEEIAFTQLTASWVINTSATNIWTFGIGYNLIYQKIDSLVNGENKKEFDVFVMTSMRRGLGPKSFYEFSLELKNQTLVTPPEAIEIGVDPEQPVSTANPADISVPAADLDENARATTLLGTLEGPIFGAKGKLKGGFAMIDTEGKLKKKDVLRLSADLTFPIGTFLLGVGVKAKKNEFKEPNPLFDNIVPEETLTTYFLSGVWPLSGSWILTAEYLTESQSSNVADSEYENSAFSSSVIFIY